MSRCVYVIPPFDVKVWIEEALMKLARSGDWGSKVNIAGSIRLRLGDKKRFSAEKIAELVNWKEIYVEGSPPQEDELSNVVPIRAVPFGTCIHCGQHDPRGVGQGLPCPNCGEVSNFI